MRGASGEPVTASEAPTDTARRFPYREWGRDRLGHVRLPTRPGTASRVAWSPTRLGKQLGRACGRGRRRPAGCTPRCVASKMRIGGCSPGSAAGIRVIDRRGAPGAVEDTGPLRLTAAANPGLFRRTDEGEPPLDEHGDL